VGRIKTALVTIDHRNYVSVLNVMKAASNASRPELSTADKVAAVVSATAAANFSRQEVAMAAASATRAAVGSSAATAAPLSSVARSAAAAGLSVSAQAAAVAAVGAESPRSQLAIANMFSSAAAASATPNMDMWTGGFGYGESYRGKVMGPGCHQRRLVGRKVAEEVYDAEIPEKEKRAIVASATWAAARAETASRQLNGTAGLPEEVAGDFLALSRASHAAGFSDSATAVMKHQWQDMSPQQRAVAAKVLKAVSSAQGQKRPRKGASSAERVASVVRALEDAGVPASEEAAFAAEALRQGAAVEEDPQVAPGSKTILDDIVDLVKSAGLSSAQQSGILQVVASMQPTERRAIARIWAAAGNRSSTAPFITHALDAGKQSEQRLPLSTPAPPDQTKDAEKALELLNVVVYAAIQAGAPPSVLDKVNALAQNMTPEEQMAAAAAVLNSTQKAPEDRDALASVADAIARHRKAIEDEDSKQDGVPALNSMFESIAAPPESVQEYEATHHGGTGFVFLVRLASDRLWAFVQQAVGETIVNRSSLTITSAAFSFSWPTCGQSRFRDARALHFPDARFMPTRACGGLAAQSRETSGFRLPATGSQELFWLSGELGHGENLLLIQIQELILHEFRAGGQTKEYSLCGGHASTYIGCPSEAPVDLVYPAHGIGAASTFCSESSQDNLQNAGTASLRHARGLNDLLLLQAMAGMRGDAGLVWARACELALQQKIDEATAMCTEMEEKSQRLGVRVTQAAAAVSRAVVGLCRSPAGEAFIQSLRSLGATWGEASLLLTDASSNNLPDPGDSPWGEAVKAAKSVPKLNSRLFIFAIMMSLRYRRTFIDVDEEPPVKLFRSGSVPAHLHIEDEDAETKKELASVYQRMAQWRPELPSSHPGSDQTWDSTVLGEVDVSGSGVSDETTVPVMSPGPRGDQVCEAGTLNPGSYGHPEVCRKPCVFFQVGQCENGECCGYCHFHHKRPLMPNQRQRSILRKLSQAELLHTFLPILWSEAGRTGIASEATHVVHILADALDTCGMPRAAKLVGSDAEHLRGLLSRMSFGSLMAMLLHNLKPSAVVDAARTEFEAMRRIVQLNA
ncbi:RPL35, partial [Symbiodinium microadriaticum]